MAGDPTLAELVDDMISSRLNDVHTMQPGTVVSYARGTHTVEVKLGIQRTITRADGSELLEDVPPIPNVPVVLPKAGGFYLQLPMVAGDEGLLLFSEAAWGHFRENGQLSPPGDLRRHSLSYAAFLPCGLVNDDGYDTTAPAGGAVLIVPSSKQLSVRRAGAGGSDDFVAMAAKTNTELDAIRSDLATFAAAQAAACTGPLAPLATGFTNLGTAIGPPSGDTASSTLKAQG